MSDEGPLGDDNPLEGLPFFGDIARLLRQGGSGSWEIATQVAVGLATGGAPEGNVDPAIRFHLQDLARAAELHVTEITGFTVSATGRAVELLPVTRGEWARRTVDAYRPYLERLAGSLAATQGGLAGEGASGDPTDQLLAGLMQMIGPMMLGMQSGVMVGHLATRSFGQYDLPLPRPPGDELLIVPANVDAFAEEWSLPVDDLRMWICISELTHHAVLGRPHVRARLDALITEFVTSFTLDPNALEHRIGSLDPTDPNALQQAFGDPEALLGALQSDAQRQLLPHVAALTAAVVGYVDYVLDTVGPRLLGSYGMLTEALRRRRVEASAADRFVERLLGLELDDAHYERASAFVDGIVQRAGPDALRRLWHAERELPTPAEVDAPGLWLARIDLPD